jgi:hypothetical protein
MALHVFDVASQLPEQHWALDAQAEPSCAHTFVEQVPPTQESEQHSEESAHFCPGDAQNAAVVHTVVCAPEASTSQTAEQHSLLSWQVVPAALQVSWAGTEHVFDAASQLPEQHWASPLQDAASAAQLDAGAVHTPLPQEPLQHSEPSAHAWPSAVHWEGSAHFAPGHAPEQQSSGDAQVAPSARHAAFAAGEPAPGAPGFAADLEHAGAALKATKSERKGSDRRVIGELLESMP